MKKVKNYKLKILLKKFQTVYKNVYKIIKFYDAEIGKYKFYQYKIPILIENIDFNKIVVSNKISFDEKVF